MEITTRIEAKHSRGNKQRELEWAQAKDRTTQANSNPRSGVTVRPANPEQVHPTNTHGGKDSNSQLYLNL